MIEADRIVTAQGGREEESLDRAVRPRLLADYVGQPAVCAQMEIFIEAARRRSEALDHLLIFGPPGLGKTTLAHIVANELGVGLKQTSGPVLERPGDLAALLRGPGRHGPGRLRRGRALLRQASGPAGLASLASGKRGAGPGPIVRVAGKHVR